jgi:hypothetical protein
VDGDAGLDRYEAHAVGDHVVQFPRYPEAFIGHCAFGKLAGRTGGVFATFAEGTAQGPGRAHDRQPEQQVADLSGLTVAGTGERAREEEERAERTDQRGGDPAAVGLRQGEGIERERGSHERVPRKPQEPRQDRHRQGQGEDRPRTPASNGQR